MNISDDRACKTKRILAVDDEIAFLLALKKILINTELEVDTAETMQEAIDLIESRKYDAVIADIRLTGVLQNEGLMILGHLKKACNGTKVIMMTGYGNPDVMQEVYNLGADYYFEKPVSVNVLKSALTELRVL